MIKENSTDTNKNIVASILELLTFKPLVGITYAKVEQACFELLGSKLTAMDARSLIGFSFSKTVQEAYKGFLNRHPNAKEDKNILVFNQVFDQITRNFYQESLGDLKASSNELLDFSSIQYNLAALNSFPNYHILTFQDDFLLSENDLNQLSVQFKNQMILKIPGGHLGGFYQMDFRYRLTNLLLNP